MPAKERADLIVHNAVVYTVDESFSIVESLAVKDGAFIDKGPSALIRRRYAADDMIDAGGRPVYPGFIDAHCHFLNYGLGLSRADLTEASSFNDVLEMLEIHHRDNPSEWILGRGWDQNRWEDSALPTRSALDRLFPNSPVMIRRVAGHAALVNTEALERAGVDANTAIDGGRVERDGGVPTGLLIDKAMSLVDRVIPDPTRDEKLCALLKAQEKCFEVGLTTVDDAGLDGDEVALIDSLHRAGTLRMKMYAMLVHSEENLGLYLHSGPQKTERLNVRSFKFLADGALGSSGAALLEPYHDDPSCRGLLLEDPARLEQIARTLYDAGFQMNTHCIGDAAVRMALEVYADVLLPGDDRRWRVEHAQVVHEDDFARFAGRGIIPSVQAVHATSDMGWAGDKLGPQRLKNAYAYGRLLKGAGLIANGSDFPVERVNPLLGFHAAVARKDLDGRPEEGFQTGDALSREEALKAMTLWAAAANFEESEKGSIEKGKRADFVILEGDIMTIDMDDVPATTVYRTYVDGENVYSA